MKSVVIENLPLFCPLRSSLLYTNLRLSLRFSLSNRRFTTGASYIRAVAEERHKRAAVSKTVMAPATIVLDQFIIGTFVASLFAFVFLYVLRRSSNDVIRNKKSKKNRGLVVSTKDDSGTDVIIVGAGVAGAALANSLGKEGRRVHIIERDLSEQDNIVGELLQPGGYLKLIDLGLEDCLKKIDAQRILGYALFKDGKHTKLSYPLQTFDSDVAGRSFHNGRFVQRMREKAATLSNIRLEQGTVTSLLEENGTIKGDQSEQRRAMSLDHMPLSQLYVMAVSPICVALFANLRLMCPLLLWVLFWRTVNSHLQITGMLFSVIHHPSYYIP